MALYADASDEAKLQRKPSNASDMQAIKQSRCRKRCENAENNARHRKQCKRQKAMQRGRKTMQRSEKTVPNAENRARHGKRGKAGCKIKTKGWATCIGVAASQRSEKVRKTANETKSTL